MSTVQVEVLRKEAAEAERDEIERIRKKYKERQKQTNRSEFIDPEKQALIKQAQQQEKQEKEQLIQKYKQRQKQLQQTNNTTQTINQENEDSHENSANEELVGNNNLRALFEEYDFYETESDIQLEINSFSAEVEGYDLQSENIDLGDFEANEELKAADEHTITEDNNLPENSTLIKKIDIENIEETTEKIETNKTPPITGKNYINDGIDANNLLNELDVEDLGVELEEIETVDRSALMSKYNLQDVQEDDVDQILQNFDRTILDEDIEEIEERLVERIKKSTLSHSKIEWVNVLVFLDEEELEGSVKIFAEYVDGGLLNRIRSEDIQRLEFELMQLALYEVWDVLTTLGVNIDDLESKLDVEVELDRA